MTLDLLCRLTRTVPYRAWAAAHRVDAAKVKAELAGERRPRPASGFARILVELAREAQPAPKSPAAQDDLGVFAGRGVFLRDPRSGSEVEKCREWAAAGYTWVAFNLGDYWHGDWSRWSSQAWRNGLRRVCWARCYTRIGVRLLVADAEAFDYDAVIVNLEQEPDEPRWRLTAQDVKDALQGYEGEVAFSTEPWLPDNFDWHALSDHVCLPQAFLNEDARFTPETVTARARQLGFTRVAPTFGVYQGQAGRPGRDAYEWDGPFSVFAGDDLSVAEIKEWT